MSTRVVAGYDGSPAAGAAIEAAAQLLPGSRAWVAHLWTPPFASSDLRRRLRARARDVRELTKAIEYEGEREANRIAATGVTLARAAGWEAEPLVVRSYGGDGLRFTELAEKVGADVVVVGSRGLGGARAVLGSVSDMVVHYTARPVLVIPYPLLAAEHDVLAAGPVVVGFDGSAGARTALAVATRLFANRSVRPVTVDDGQTSADSAPAPSSAEIAVARVAVPNRHLPPGRGVAEALSAFAQSQGAAVLVVGSRGRSGVKEILLGSVAMASLHRAHRPVMVVSPE